MKIALASDHAGYMYKEKLKSYLEAKGYEIEDFGCSSDERCDYPDYGIPAAKSVAEGKNNKGILICGNGIGMSIMANKIPGILAALVYSVTTARDTRRHHDSNVLCLGAREFSLKQIFDFVDIWLDNKIEFAGEPHNIRIAKIKKLEK